MNLVTLLALGRVSNLPTVWTNAIAGAWLAGTPPSHGCVAATALALSLFYTGGMFLNDACDRHVDATERPERPIPSGQVRAGTVFTIAAIQIAAGFAALVYVARRCSGDVALTIGAGVALAGVIVLYDVAHRRNPLAPWVMGTCRALVYVCAAAATSASQDVDWPALLPAAAGLAAYTAGITYVAAVESSGAPSRHWPAALLLLAPLAVAVTGSRGATAALALALGAMAWTALSVATAARRDRPDVPAGVTRLIAGMCLVDAAWIASTGAPAVVTALALAGLPATRLLQRRVAGT